jgi:hypothetical protein
MPSMALPPGYPDKLSANELEAALRTQFGDLESEVYSTGLNPTLRNALLQAGLQEQSKRQLRQAARFATWISLLALGVSTLSLVVSYFN